MFHAVPESISLEPGIAFYNVGNFSNFGNQTTTLYNTNSAGAVNNAAGGGTGTFDQGAPRSAEFQLKVNF